MAKKGYTQTTEHREAIRKSLLGHKTSDETKRKIGFANRGVWIKFLCDNCGKESEEKISHYKRKKRHFCSNNCYAIFRKEKLPFNEQHAYKGIAQKAGDINLYHLRYVAKNPERISHLKARRYAREKGAEGKHSLEEWEALKKRYANRCVHCKELKPLTKDHIIPLAEGGTDYITNIQPLCRNCNSKKWKKILTAVEGSINTGESR